MCSRARSRLSLISRHVNTRPLPAINTPFSIERIPNVSEEVIRKYTTTALSESTHHQLSTGTRVLEEDQTSDTMSGPGDHPRLMIPGPIEFDDAVLQSMSHYSESHVGMPFVKVFGETLTMLRRVFQTSSAASQPFVISGSGTLGWDMVAANLVEPGDDVLVLHTGYFADSFADCFATYGINATQLKAPIGSRPQPDEIEAALMSKTYKMMTVTAVDTSTGVLSDLQSLSQLVRRVSPETLIVVDAVCAVASEEIAFDAWDLDVVHTASQKALGCPAGLSILMASGRAMQRFQARRTPPTSYFGSFKNWLPVMQNYEACKPSYFATPPPQLIHALHTACTQILSRPLSARFDAHRDASRKVKSFIARLGLHQLATDPANQATGMTAFYLPDGVKAAELLPKLTSKGVILAGGLHREIAGKYVRIGHMGTSVVDPKRDDVDRALKAIEEALQEAGYQVPSVS